MARGGHWASQEGIGSMVPEPIYLHDMFTNSPSTQSSFRRSYAVQTMHATSLVLSHAATPTASSPPPLCPCLLDQCCNIAFSDHYRRQPALPRRAVACPSPGRAQAGHGHTGPDGAAFAAKPALVAGLRVRPADRWPPVPDHDRGR